MTLKSLNGYDLQICFFRGKNQYRRSVPPSIAIGAIGAVFAVISVFYEHFETRI
jgi:hypothetical protein